MDFYDSELFNYWLLPLIIFLSRIVDVSIGTIRIVFISRGKKILAPILGFFEVLVWIIVVSKVMQNAVGMPAYIGYAAGFAMGNYIGMLIEEKLAIGVVVVRIITSLDAVDLRKALTDSGFGITAIDAEGAKGKVDVIFTTVKRQDLSQVVDIIRKEQPKAFYSVEDVKFVKEGIFPSHKAYRKRGIGAVFNWRVGK
jgi:uncharacterized protein YebE (UPF0316 family)